MTARALQLKPEGLRLRQRLASPAVESHPAEGPRADAGEHALSWGFGDSGSGLPEHFCAAWRRPPQDGPGRARHPVAGWRTAGAG